MINKAVSIGFWLLLLAAAGLGQTSFQELTPGRSTRADVDRLLGQPVRRIKATLFEYQAPEGLASVEVEYREGSTVVERIQVFLTHPTQRAALIGRFDLPSQGEARKKNALGEVMDYFGPPALLAFTYADGAEVGGVASITYYSRESFNRALDPTGRAPNSPSAREAEWRQVLGRWRKEDDSIIEIRETPDGIEGVFIAVESRVIKPGDLSFKNARSAGGRVIETDEWFSYDDKKYCTPNEPLGIRTGKGTIRVHPDGNTLTATRTLYSYSNFMCQWDDGSVRETTWQRIR